LVFGEIMNLITNGDMVNWDALKPTDWSVEFLNSGGSGLLTDVGSACHWSIGNATARLWQEILEVGKTYFYSFTVTNYSSGHIHVTAGDAPGLELEEVSANGTYSGTFINTFDGHRKNRLVFRGNGSQTVVNLDLDDVVVVQLNQEIPTGGHQALERVYNKTRMKSQNSIIHRIFQSAGVPGGSNMLVGDLCWDYTNEDAYICTVDGTTVVKMNA
jgi:hypothetical protein